jgi:hypothetical protein
VEVSTKITALTPNTEYHFRIVTKNAGGTIEGPDVTFKTLKVAAPSVETKAATGVGQTTATFEREHQPKGRPAQHVQVRIRHEHQIWVERVVLDAARVRVEPGGGVRASHVGPDREHRIPLQNLGDELGRHEQRRRRGVQDDVAPHAGRRAHHVGLTGDQAPCPVRIWAVPISGLWN